MSKLLKIKHLIEQLNISKSTIYRLIQQNKFPKAIKIGNGSFWREEDIEKWLSSQSS